MIEKNKKQNVSDLLYPPLKKVIDNELEIKKSSSIKLEPIYFDPHILCCPYCGNKNLNRGGYSKGIKKFICKQCDTSFIDPSQRKGKPKCKPPKRNKDKYINSDRFCCPSCGNEDIRKAGSSKGKTQYKCKNIECNRAFIDPKLRKKSTVKGIYCKYCNSNRCRKTGSAKTAFRKQRYMCLECDKSFALGTTRIVHPKNIPLSEDVWDARSLGLKPSPTKSLTKLNFTNISQVWLKEIFKRFIKIQATKKAFSTIQTYFVGINKFSVFLDELYPEINSIEQISREIVLNYFIYVNSQPLKASTIRGMIGALRTFLEDGSKYNLFEIESYLIIPEQDYPKVPKHIPRYIPNYVQKQLNKHLDKLPEPVARMVLVTQECGMRYIELATIKFDCLEYLGKDSLNNEKWNIKYYDFKLKKDRIRPISPELAEIVKNQQNYIRSYFGESSKYLFTSRDVTSNTGIFKPELNEIMVLDSFTNYLNGLSIDYQIKDENGKLWKFESHQFRHTVGTEAIQNGVPLHIVMKLLGHSSPEMTMRYAHIHDETLRKELNKFHENRTIDITGQIVSLELEGDLQDLEWFTKEICAIALPNGYCGRPKILGDCDIAGDVGCYLCPHFRTNKNFLSVHKEQLESIDKVLAKAYKYNWQLPIKKNEPIKQNLKLIISTLEADNEQAQ